MGTNWVRRIGRVKPEQFIRLPPPSLPQFCSKKRGAEAGQGGKASLVEASRCALQNSSFWLQKHRGQGRSGVAFLSPSPPCTARKKNPSADWTKNPTSRKISTKQRSSHSAVGGERWTGTTIFLLLARGVRKKRNVNELQKQKLQKRSIPFAPGNGKGDASERKRKTNGGRGSCCCWRPL